MRRRAIMLGFLFLAGCGTKGTPTPPPPPADPLPLWPRQREAWEGLRRQERKGPAYTVVAYLPGQGGWWGPHRGADGRHTWGIAIDVRYPKPGEARQAARRLVAGGEAEAGAVIDLFGGENPRPVAWFTPGREGDGAPDPELDAGLRLYLHNLQCLAGGLGR